tara:strand:+ start:936 stop:1142 length:207 start_codon:yes stop_codon:yes gene_type:complete
MQNDNLKHETPTDANNVLADSDFKNKLLKAFLAGRQLGKYNKLTSWDEELGKDIEHGGFEGWFHYHFR